jgi:hypothetical protein
MSKSLKEQLETKVQEIEEKAAEEWLNITDELGVEYKRVETLTDDVKLKPVDGFAALSRNFGSSTLDIKAEFWYSKAKKELLKRLSDA